MELACFIMRYCDVNSDLYKRAMIITKRMIDRLKSRNNHGEMGIGGYCVLLDTIKQYGLGDKFDYENLQAIVHQLVKESIERDTSKWIYYGKRPSNYITSPDSRFYKENEEIVQKELDYLIDTRPDAGVWNITWSWFDNNEVYPKEYAISENWWKASKAIEKMVFLRNFKRIVS